MKNIKSARSQQEKGQQQELGGGRGRSRRSILVKDTHSSWLEKWLAIKEKKARKKPIND